jgi:NAD(P)H dehydrogenase (quinone)
MRDPLRRLAIALPLLIAGSLAPAPHAQTPSPGRPRAAADVLVLVAYTSRTGATEAMSLAVEQGAASVPGTRVVRKRVGAVTEADLLAADAIVLGTPVHNAGVAADMKAFVDRWPFDKLQNKVGAVFVAAGNASAGEEVTMLNTLASMLIYRFVIVGGESVDAALGASAITSEGRPKDEEGKPSAAALAKARGLGERVARVAKALAAGGWPDKQAPTP